MTKKATVMIVEDNRIVAEDLKVKLGHLGYSVSAIATTGERAIEAAAAQVPDIVLMDIELGGRLNGIDTAQLLTAQYQTPVVYLTAYADKKTVARAKITEPFGYIVKPFEDQEVFSTIEIALYKHQVERELKESRKWLFTTLTSIGDAVIATDEKGCVKFMNPVAEALTGWAQAEAAGKPLEEIFVIINENTRQPVENPVVKVMSCGGIVGLANHTLLISRGGREIPIKDSGAPILGDKGHVAGVVLVFQDDSQSRQAQKAIEESEARYRTLVESSSDHIFMLSPEGSYLASNDRVDRFRMERGEQIVGKHLRGIYPAELAGLYAEKIQAVIQAKKPLEFAHDLPVQDGALHESVTLFPVYNGGALWAVGGIGRDVTALKQAEIEREKLERRLQHAQKIESVGLLAGGIAHDFNNILTTIIGNISLAKHKLDSVNEVMDLLNEVETASTRAQMLTKQLLTFATGGSPVKEAASIRDTLKESCRFVLRGSQSRCEFSISDDLWPAEVDTGQISQVIHNIVINANQAMPKGGTIRVSAENVTSRNDSNLPLNPGKYIKISVADQGVGIAEDHLPNIFDPYFTTKQEGSGLGLATSYSIIKKHDGRIAVESKLGAGATFHIYLPATDKPLPEKRNPDPVKGRGRILVMDDESSLRKMMGKMLSMLGYESESARNGDEAVRMFREARESGNPFDAVILDLTIPGGMGGKEAVRRMLQMDPGIKAIVSSGYSGDPVLADYSEYGFKGIAPKPFNAQSLGQVLEKVLQGSNS
jgi:PAS domain S-box-containing protein